MPKHFPSQTQLHMIRPLVTYVHIILIKIYAKLYLFFWNSSPLCWNQLIFLPSWGISWGSRSYGVTVSDLCKSADNLVRLHIWYIWCWDYTFFYTVIYIPNECVISTWYVNFINIKMMLRLHIHFYCNFHYYLGPKGPPRTPRNLWGPLAPQGPPIKIMLRLHLY